MILIKSKKQRGKEARHRSGVDLSCFFTSCFLFLISCFLFTPSAYSASSSEVREYGQLKTFALTERSGRTITLDDLKGKTWLVNFIFTRCSGPCPILTQNMQDLEKTLPEEVHILSITVDPEYDTPEILTYYAEEYQIHSNRWLFVTGKKEEIYGLIRNGFQLGVTKDDTSRQPGTAFIHSTRFVIMDSENKIRGYYDGMDPASLKLLTNDLKWMLLRKNRPYILKLPIINAGLNLLCILFLWTGFQFIRRKKITFHRFCMTSAFLVSILFLSSYLTYHYYAGSVPFLKEGWIRLVYFTILISHTILAALIVPLALTTFYFVWRKNFEKHKRIARWTLPLWLYVSVTGVLVYWMLYQL